jgi:hypothetical protein
MADTHPDDGEYPPPGMRRQDTQVVERRAVRRVESLIEDELGWIARPQPLPDYGIDAQAEVLASDDLVTGRLLGLQIKGGDSQFVEAKPDGWVFRENLDHLAYWLGHSLRVVVVIVDPGGEAFWQVVDTSTVHETRRGFSMLIPRSQPFDRQSLDRLLELAGRSAGLLESLPLFYVLLPTDAVTALTRAEPADRLATARLAERLASGRFEPGLTAASVIAAEPTWLARSPATQDLWMAVGAYAAQHDHDAEAAEAFERAANAQGPRAARARAWAGLSLLFIDRDRARALLHSAREQGQQLLADVGLPSLDVPIGDARVFDIPESMQIATPEELDAEPTVLNFLAEMAVRRNELDLAVEYLQRAVRHGSGHRMHLALAQTLHRRLSSNGYWSPRDLRAALTHAQAAVEDRRRWAGPSSEALSALIDVHINAGSAAEALKLALPASEGGFARDIETNSPEVARRGAVAALMAGDQQAHSFFMRLLPDGPERRELEAMESDQHEKLSNDERVAIWTALLKEANDDNALVTRCISRLAQLGVWPGEADGLRARSIIPGNVFETLRAVFRVRSGEPAVGLAALRELAQRTPHAVYQLVTLLEEEVGGEAAIEECEAQLIRWQDPTLTTYLVDLLRRHGGEDRAATLVERSIRDDSLAIDVRLSFSRWYVAHKAKQRDFGAATVVARAGLALADDPELAWNLVIVLFNDGKVLDARAALGRHRPEPTSQEEVRLWLQLHLGVPLSNGDARTLVALLQRQPQGELRSAMVGLLIREVLSTDLAGQPAYTDDIISAATEHAAGLERGPGPGMRLVHGAEEALRAALEDGDIDPVEFKKLVEQVRRGVLSLGELAHRAKRPYGAALLQRPVGMIVAADLPSGLRRAGEEAASLALGLKECAVDLSALHLLGLLDDDTRLRIRAGLPRMTVAVSAVHDSIQTSETVRGLVASTFTAALKPNGTIERDTLSPWQRTLLSKQAALLEATAASLDVHYPTRWRYHAQDAIELAHERALPLWCDDIALRQDARGRGVRCFGILDLVTVLASRDAEIDLSSFYRRLLANYVVDLPVGRDDLVAVASATDWAVGPAHTSIAREEWWRYRSSTWSDEWLALASASRTHSAEALVDFTRAALVGATQAVTRGLGSQRHQDVVGVALVACHAIGESAPHQFLDEVAQGVDPQLVPRPTFVFSAVASMLGRRGVTEPGAAALELLPDVSLQ